MPETLPHNLLEPEGILELIRKIVTFPIFSVKQTPVTLTSMFVFILFMAFFAFLSRVVRRFLMRWLTRVSSMEEGTRFVLVRVIQYIILIVGAILSFQFVGIDFSGLAVIFGLLSVGIGFGLQNLTSNFVAGLILLFERPIRVGDRITVGDTEGDVEEINIRSTTIRSLENISIIVPNSEFISSRVVNWSYGDKRMRVPMDVGVSYSSNLDDVIAALMAVAQEHSEVLKDPAPEVRHRGFGDSAWDMRLWIWVADPKEVPRIRSEINCAIVRKFREKGIEIPFPQRDLHVRSSISIPIQSAS